MHDYLVHYRDQQMGVVAETSLAAQQIAIDTWRPRRPQEVHAVLIRLNGQDISHTHRSFEK